MAKGCKCEKCVKCCTHLPGIPLPNQIPKMAKHLGMTVKETLEKHFIIGWRKDIFIPGDTIRFAYPARKGFENTLETYKYVFNKGACTFLKNNLCQIHPVKPYECAKAFGCKKSRGHINRNRTLREWKEVLHYKTLHPDVVEFIGGYDEKSVEWLVKQRKRELEQLALACKIYQALVVKPPKFSQIITDIT